MTDNMNYTLFQVIRLKDGSDSNGCVLTNKTGELFYDCNGERVFRSSVARTWFFAVSRCGSSGLLNLDYVFNITGKKVLSMQHYSTLDLILDLNVKIFFY